MKHYESSTAKIFGINLLFWWCCLTTISLFAGNKDETVDYYASQPYGPPPEITEYASAVDRGKIYYVKASPEKGFHWPYYFVVPKELNQPATILVQPNNDGQTEISLRSREYFASITNEQAWLDFGRPLRAVALTPVFPRPALNTNDENIYVHALTRSTMLATQKNLLRIDLQLLAMTENLRSILSQQNIVSDEQMLLWGFSAAGDFVSRFTTMHPKKVKAVAAGGMGGLPILPISTLANAELDYPVGIADLSTVSGSEFDVNNFRKVPVLFMQGVDDQNDSVQSVPENTPRDEYGSDSYSYEQAVMINSMFGEQPIERVDKVTAVYSLLEMHDFNYMKIPNVEHKDRPLKPLALEFFKRILSIEDKQAKTTKLKSVKSGTD